MANFTPADLAQSATNATSKTDQEILDAAGRVVNGVVILTNDPSVPDSKKGPFLDAIADLFERGAGPTYETLSGQPAARLAIGGGSGSPDPVTNPVPTPADAAKNAKAANFDVVIQWIGANGGNVIAGEDIKVTLDRLLTAKVDAAKTVPAEVVKKVDGKPYYEALDQALEDQHWKDAMWKGKATTETNLTNLKKVRDDLKVFLGIS